MHYNANDLSEALDIKKSETDEELEGEFSWMFLSIRK